MRSFANFNALVAVVKRNLDRVVQPALIVHPRADDIASLKNAQYLQTHLGGLVDTLVLDDSYHMVTLDQQRHIVAERTASFVTWLENGVRERARTARLGFRGAARE
jgi:carboxylesterase